MPTIEFNNRFSKMTPILNAFAYNLTQNIEDAHDLFQETAYRALANWEKFRPDTNFKAWLFTIMKNIFINNYRKKMKAKTRLDATNNMYFLNSSKKVIYNRSEGDILIKELRRMIDRLEDSIRIPFLMHYEGYKYQEIADKFNLPLGTVKSRIFFARRKLKAMIKKRYANIDEFKYRMRG